MAQKQKRLTNIIRIGFATVMVLFLANSAGIFWIDGKTRENLFWVVHTHEVKLRLGNLIDKFTDAETGQRGFLYTQRDEYLEPYNKALTSIKEIESDVVKLVKDNPMQLARMKVVSDIGRQKLDELAETIELQRAGRQKAAFDIVVAGKGKQLMDDIRMHVSEMIATEERLLGQRNEELEKSKALMNAILTGGTIFALIVGIAILVFINRIFIRKFLIPVGEAVNVISSSSSEITATMDEHERVVSQQSAAVTETTTTVEELGISSQQSAAQAEAAAAAAKQALDVTIDGIDLANQVSGSMVGMKQKVASVAEQILRLSEQASQIGGIARVVGELAGEINMLALNAAVEAARAGEHGKGFAVVASEVRKLADQSRKSAEKANALVAEIQTATNAAVMVTEDGIRTADEVAALVERTIKAFGSISDRANSVAVSAQQVLLNSRQQASALGQVTEAMRSLATGSTQMASGTEQTKKGVEKLNSVAVGLEAMV